MFPHCTVSAVARASRVARPPVKIYNLAIFADHHLFQVKILIECLVIVMSLIRNFQKSINK